MNKMMNEAIKRAMIREYGKKMDLRYCPVPEGTLRFWSNKTGLSKKEVLLTWEVYVLSNWCERFLYE